MLLRGVRAKGAGQARQCAPDAEVGGAERDRGVALRVLDLRLRVAEPAAATRGRGLPALESARQRLREQRSESFS